MNIENQNPNLEYLTHEFISSLIKKKNYPLRILLSQNF